MPETTNQTFEPDYSRALDIESLISAPLVAVSKANVTMAQGQTNFLLDYCFTKVGDSYEPVMIKMALNRSAVIPENEQTKDQDASISIQAVTSYFNLPLLTIVPLNSLAVDKVTIEFDMEISGSSGKPADRIPGSGDKITDQKAQLYGKISHDSNSGNDLRKNKSKISININAAKLPLPSGVLTIIDLYNKSIHATPEKN